MFKRRSSSSSASVHSSPHTSAPPSLQTPSSASEADNDLSNGHHHHLGDEVKRYALAAVLMDEWLLELSAIAQEQSVLQNKKAYEVGMGLEKGSTTLP